MTIPQPPPPRGAASAAAAGGPPPPSKRQRSRSAARKGKPATPPILRSRAELAAEALQTATTAAAAASAGLQATMSTTGVAPERDISAETIQQAAPAFQLPLMRAALLRAFRRVELTAPPASVLTSLVSMPWEVTSSMLRDHIMLLEMAIAVAQDQELEEFAVRAADRLFSSRKAKLSTRTLKFKVGFLS